MAAFQKAIDAIDRTTSLSFTDSSQPIQVAVGDLSGVSISVSGTFTGSLAFEGSVSGTSWSAIAVYRLSDNTESATITTAGQYGINSTAFSQIKIIPTVSSGTAVVEMLAITGNSLIVGGGSTTIDFGTKIDAATMPTGGDGVLGWISALFVSLGNIFQLLSDRFPALVSGRIPVQVSSLNVTVDNASLEIANDTGNPVPVSGTVTANTGLSQPLTDTQLRASAVPISGTVAISNSSLEIANDVGNPIPISDAGGSITVDGTFWQATQPVSGTISLAAETGFLSKRNTALSNTPFTIKTSPGSVMGWNFINVNPVTVYVKFYNAVIANVTVGTTAPLLTIAIPPGVMTNAAFHFQESSSIPQEVFDTAISIACVTGLADNNNTAPSTAIHASVRYK
jgi:hypothetical protein